MCPLDALTAAPVAFVYPDDGRWADLYSPSSPVDPNAIYGRFRSGADAYIVRTYLELKTRGYNVEFIPEISEHQTCVIYAPHVRLRSVTCRHSLIVVQGDNWRPRVCTARVVPNRRQVRCELDQYIPHWQQPGLIPRNPARGIQLERVGFMGNLLNLAPDLRSQSFQEALGRLGCTLEIRGPARWHDFSDIDLVVGLRASSHPATSMKPATKLFNAWAAGCPALLGNEAGYSQERRQDVDFLTVRNAADVLNAVQRLRRDTQFYQAMIDRAAVRAYETSSEVLVGQWVEFIRGVTSPIGQQKVAQDQWDPALKIRFQIALWREKISRMSFTFAERRFVKRLFKSAGTTK